MVYFSTRLAAWFTFHLLGYRRKVVRKNLEIVFPDKPPAYHKKIYKDFIRGFSETIAEIIKGFSMDAEDFQRRFDFQVTEDIKTVLAGGQDMFLIGAHINQWEWAAIAIGDQFPCRAVGIYKPLSSKAMDRILLDLRQKLGTRMIPMAHVVRDILRENRPVTAYIFLSDQSTPFTNSAHWPDFFGHETPFVPGMAVLAQRKNVPVYYFNIKKIRRGYYEAHFTLLMRNSAAYSPEEITAIYSKKVEENILNDPASWLWTHKRWKRVLSY